MTIYRHLLEGEDATFSHNNLTISFKDPLLQLPGKGKIILRNDEFEHVLSVPSDL